MGIVGAEQVIESLTHYSATLGSIVAAYQQATSQAQHLIDVAAHTDPAFSQTLRPELRN